MREGMREWAVSKGPKLDKASKNVIEEAMEIFLEAGPRSTRWSTAVIEADTASRQQAILNELEKYKKHLDARISAWRTWKRWVVNVRNPQEVKEGVTPTDPFLPEPVVLGHYLLEKKKGLVGKGGPTAASGAWWHLEWWRTHIGLQIPTADDSNVGFKTATQGHVVYSGTSATVGPF